MLGTRHILPLLMLKLIAAVDFTANQAIRIIRSEAARDPVSVRIKD